MTLFRYLHHSTSFLRKDARSTMKDDTQRQKNKNFSFDMAETTTVYLINGASSGIDLELTKQLCAQKGNKVFDRGRGAGRPRGARNFIPLHSFKKILFGQTL